MPNGRLTSDAECHSLSRTLFGAAKTMQSGCRAVSSQALGPFGLRRELFSVSAREFGGMIHMDEMSDLMRGEIIQHERRGHDQTPREIQSPFC